MVDGLNNPEDTIARCGKGSNGRRPRGLRARHAVKVVR